MMWWVDRSCNIILANWANKAKRTDKVNSDQRLIVFYWANRFLFG